MAIALTPAGWLNFASGVALFILGVAVALLRRRHVAAIGLGLFCGGLGVQIALQAIFAVAPRTTAVRVLEIVVRLIYAVGAFILATRTPWPLTRREPRAILVLAVSVLALIALLGVRALREPQTAGGGDVHPSLAVAAAASVIFVGAVASGLLLVLPMRFAAAPDADARRTVVLLALGFTVFASGSAGLVAGGGATLGRVVSVVGIVLSAVLWLLPTSGPHGALARNTAIAICAILLANALVGAWDPAYAIPLSRAVGVLLLAFAVMRGLIAGLDTKVHFAISKGTVAAIFVVVFFVASELAQQFFAARYTALVGIVAAGMLIFALAPLQRAAERFAERAVPLADPALARPSAAADVYKAAVRAAMRDGVLTRREEGHLAEVARGLGLDPVQAHELRDAVEAERT